MNHRRPPGKTLNLNVRGMADSATLAINERCDRLRSRGRQVYKLGLGQSPFPVPDAVVEGLRASAHEKDYLPVRGLPVLREAVAAYLARRQGVSYAPENVLIGPGSKELMFLLQLVFYGEILIPTPAWVSYAPQARIIGRNVRFLDTTAAEGWLLHPDTLAELCGEDPDRPRIIILNYPANPTGATYKSRELKQLARVARNHGVLVLSDEIYGELHYKGQHVTIARYYPEGTIISGGLSKWCGAGGWRLGTFLFPANLRWLCDSMAVVASETFTSTSAPIQYAAVRAFEGGTWMEHYLSRSRRILSALARFGALELRKVGVTCQPPAGAFYLFPCFEAVRSRLADAGIATSRQLCEKLLEDTGVAILPGIEFGRDPEELTARIAFVNFDGARALEAVEAIAPDQALDLKFLRNHCSATVLALEALAGWVADLRGAPRRSSSAGVGA